MKDPQRVALGRIGALKLHGTYDSSKLTAIARAGILAKFRAEAAAVASARGEEVTDEELDRRALYLRRSHMAQLAFEREQKRRKKNAAGARAAAEEVSGADPTELPTAV